MKMHLMVQAADIIELETSLSRMKEDATFAIKKMKLLEIKWVSDQACCVIILNFTQVIVGGEGLIICFMIAFPLLFQYVLKAIFPEFIMFYWKVHLNLHFHNIPYQFSVKRNSFKILTYDIGYFILQNKTTDQMAQS